MNPGSWRRFYVSPSQRSGSGFRIVGDSLHHIRDVCRLGEGARFEVLTGEKKAFLVEVRKSEKKEIVAEILSSRDLPAISTPHLVLAASMPKFSTFETILEKSVELGVREVVPFVSEFSHVKKTKDVPPKKRERWEKIVYMATQQSGRGDVMKVAEPSKRSEAVATFQARRSAGGIFAWERGSESGLQDTLSKLPGDKDEIWIFVGSEGGFSAEEAQRFEESGLKPVTLGDRILRAETACLALVAAVQCRLGHLG